MVSKASIAVNNCFLVLFLFHFKHVYSRNQPVCHEHESSALMNLKNSFSIQKFGKRPKTESWNLRGREGRDCCNWDGVQCDKGTGHVIGLDLSRSRIFGSINSNSSLFQLVHLQILNLAQNDFNRSEIPSAIGRLSRLTHLSLHDSNFGGNIPQQLFQLSKLVSLDLSWCSLHGEVPGSIENLKSLQSLDISYCGLSGFIPASMANLTKLTYLNLSANSFYSQTVPSWLGKATQLRVLRLDKLDLKGEISSVMSNLTQLNEMSLWKNQLTGRIPLWLGNLTQLTFLDFHDNNLQGLVPDSIFRLFNIEHFYIGYNNLSGVLKLEKFLKLKTLTHLDLSFNRFSVLSDINMNETAALPKMKILGLAYCNLDKFPDFLQGQTELESLDLSANNIDGKIPRWTWGMGTETLTCLALQNNLLTGFEGLSLFLPWKQLQILSLGNNRFQGPLPIPSPTTLIYYTGGNSFTGNLPPEFCKLALLYILDVSQNNLSGIIPPCFGNFSDYLVVLSLNGNRLHGSIPETFKSGCHLYEINLSQNQLKGKLPRSFADCPMLEVIDVGNNKINDSFPHWLGSLSNLKVVNLRFNQFHGMVKGFDVVEGFSKLRIIDVSHNSFSGNLPAEYFHHLDAMKISNRRNAPYLKTKFDFTLVSYAMNYITEITFKGVEMEDLAILDTLALIDFSSNRFDGPIPEVTAKLKGLLSLNLSRNYLSGRIPPILSKLTELESLDLSHNHLSGQIPVELVGLTSLEIFNVSYNKLSGPIPHGKQFDTFQTNSYLRNSKLCGYPLSQQCHRVQTTPSPKSLEKDDADEGSTTEFNWVVISMGYASGLLIGVVIGWILTSRKHEWFVETFGIGSKQQRPRRGRRRTIYLLCVRGRKCVSA